MSDFEVLVCYCKGECHCECQELDPYEYDEEYEEYDQSA